MNDLNKLLQNVISDAMRLGIPVSNAIEPNLCIDEKRYDRVAACYKYSFPTKYEIHLSRDTLREKRWKLKILLRMKFYTLVF
jgi:hypothetical protein